MRILAARTQMSTRPPTMDDECSSGLLGGWVPLLVPLPSPIQAAAVQRNKIKNVYFVY